MISPIVGESKAYSTNELLLFEKGILALVDYSYSVNPEATSVWLVIKPGLWVSLAPAFGYTTTVDDFDGSVVTVLGHFPLTKEFVDAYSS